MASSSMTKNLNKIVEESIKEDGIWIFSDTECKVDKKVYYTWTSLFQASQDKKFVVLLQNDARTELRKFTRISSNQGCTELQSRPLFCHVWMILNGLQERSIINIDQF